MTAHDRSPSGAKHRTGPLTWLARIVEGPRFQSFITGAIILNAITLGFETWPVATQMAGPVFRTVDSIILAIFVFELGVKLLAHRARFFLSGWNVFDFVIVAISVIPAQNGFSVLRALRILRVLRLLSIVPQLRRVVEALLKSLPGMGAIVSVLFLVFYVGAVLSTKLFGPSFPEWFGSIGASMYSLFQIMTLESWSMGIVRPVMEVYPHAWTFFVPFIFLTSFMVLNLFIAIIVNSLNTLHSEEIQESEDLAHEERDRLLVELKALRAEVTALREEFKNGNGGR